MKILPLQLAWQSLFVHKVRTSLTILGIVIGIAAVIIVMSAGESLKSLVLGEFDSYGTDFIQVEVKVPTTAKNSAANAGAIASGVEVTTLTLEDAEAIGRLSNVKDQAAAIMGQSVISYLDENKVATYLAGSANMPGLMGMAIGSGRIYSQEEDDSLARVVVLGYKIAGDLFGNQDPVNQTVRIGKFRFRVVGVARERGASFGLDYDNLAYLPLQTAQKLLLGVDYVSFITAKVENPQIQYQTAAAIESLLRDRHEIDDAKDDDFAVTTAAEALELVNTVFDGVTLLLVAIAGISLLVGGVGIMNIMYVAVTERTFEIGLRKAVGARPAQILWQFLWEAVIVTFFGGVVGIIIGVSLALAISLIAGQIGFSWEFVLPPESIIISFVFAAVVGLIFGFYPARRAAALDPINALRHE